MKRNRKIKTADLAKAVAAKYGKEIIEEYKLDMTVAELETALNKIGLTLFRNVLRALIMKKKECVLRHKRRILLIIGFNRKVLKSKIHNNYGHKKSH